MEFFQYFSTSGSRIDCTLVPSKFQISNHLQEPVYETCLLFCSETDRWDKWLILKKHSGIRDFTWLSDRFT